MERKLKYLWIGNQQAKQSLFQYSWDYTINDLIRQELLEIINEEPFLNDLKIINSNIDAWYVKGDGTYLFIILADQNNELNFMNKIFKKLERLFHAYHYESVLDISNQGWINNLNELKEKYETLNYPQTTAILPDEPIDPKLLIDDMNQDSYYYNLNTVEMLRYEHLDEALQRNSVDMEMYQKRIINDFWKEWLPIVFGVIIFLLSLGLMLYAANSFKPEKKHDL